MLTDPCSCNPFISCSNPVPDTTPLTIYEIVLDGTDVTNLTGSIHETLTNLSNLRELTMSRFGSRLKGKLPSGLGKLKKQEVLNMDGNSLTGTIPESINDIGSLWEVDLTDNKLSGTIQDMSKLRMTTLCLANNTLTGTFPDFIGNMVDTQGKKFTFNIRENKLKGTLPISINWANLSGEGECPYPQSLVDDEVWTMNKCNINKNNWTKCTSDAPAMHTNCVSVADLQHLPQPQHSCKIPPWFL